MLQLVRIYGILNHRANAHLQLNKDGLIGYLLVASGK